MLPSLDLANAKPCTVFIEDWRTLSTKPNGRALMKSIKRLRTCSPKELRHYDLDKKEARGTMVDPKINLDREISRAAETWTSSV